MYRAGAIAAAQVAKDQAVLHHCRNVPHCYNNQPRWLRGGGGGRLLVVALVTVLYIRISDTRRTCGPRDRAADLDRDS